jgi:predicted peptidase
MSLPQVGGAEFPFVIACPQTDGSWSDEASRVAAMIDELVASRLVDPERVYVTGVSMGAVGCWELAAAQPDRFAALLPVSGRIPELAGEVRAPAFLIAGENDRLVDVEAVAADLERMGNDEGRIRFERDPQGVHAGSFWNRLYRRADLYEWLLKHRVRSN